MHNTVIDMFCKMGNVDRVKNVFDELMVPQRYSNGDDGIGEGLNVEPNIVT